jgi:hypothetical protein
MATAVHSTDTVFLVRPLAFGSNPQTADSNCFQCDGAGLNADSIANTALTEFNQFADTLAAHDIEVYLFEDTPSPIKPDAIFPNNWVSTHPDGTVVLYPMCAPNRRPEQRIDIIATLQDDFEVKQVLDYAAFEQQGMYLEGTGSIVFDHAARIAYACLSVRTNAVLFSAVCADLGYTPFLFAAYDKQGNEIYHTNVLMHIGHDYAVICLEAVFHKDRKPLLKSLQTSGKKIIEITMAQLYAFAGNMLMLHSHVDQHPIIVLSQTAFDSLSMAQQDELGKSGTLLPVKIPTIEKFGGGSVRCMMAEIYLRPLSSGKS